MIKVLSLFDGISCGRIALDKLNIDCEYHAFEIDERAKQVSKSNYPNSHYYSNVFECNGNDFQGINLLLGGSPCQDLSAAMKNRTGLAGQKSSLFFEYLRIFQETKPKYFLFENVGGMKQEDKDVISILFKEEPIRINSSLVSPALRNRLYWTNIPNVDQPQDKNIKLKDIIESGYVDRDKARALLSSDSRPLTSKDKMVRRYRQTGFTTLIFEDKDLSQNSCRYMTQTELERCMTIPEGYTKVLNRNQAAHHLGNGWTVDVIAHILKNMEI